MNVNTILNYVDLRGDLLTTQFPYNEIDALIFSELAYVNLDHIIEPLHQPPLWLVYQKYVQRNQSLSDQELQKIQIPSHELFEKMASSPRYQNIRILDYVNDVNKELVKQFSALALLLEDGRIVIAFRGTDDSLIGWHEDFLMLCEKSVPAQESSVHFVEHIAKLSIPSSLLADLKNDGDIFMVAKGGRGGRGNLCFKSPYNKTPKIAENGHPGITKRVVLELKLLADVGLVGLPSVGKSTFLSVVTRANPLIGNYDFTTISPNLGVC